MNFSPTWIPMIIMIGAVFGARWMNNKANEALTVEKKAELFDLFGNKNLIQKFVPMLLLVGLLFFAIKSDFIDTSISMAGGTLLYIGYFVWMMLSTRRKLLKAEFDQAYIRMTTFASVVRLSGFLLALALMVYLLLPS